MYNFSLIKLARACFKNTVFVAVIYLLLFLYWLCRGGKKSFFLHPCYQVRVPCPTCIEANTVLPALEKNKAGSTAKETGGRAQISLLDPGSGMKFKWLGEFQT